jgi:hypothetical protein
MREGPASCTFAGITWRIGLKTAADDDRQDQATDGSERSIRRKLWKKIDQIAFPLDSRNDKEVPQGGPGILWIPPPQLDVDTATVRHPLAATADLKLTSLRSVKVTWTVDSASGTGTPS